MPIDKNRGSIVRDRQEFRRKIGWEVVMIIGYHTYGDFEYQDPCQQGQDALRQCGAVWAHVNRIIPTLAGNAQASCAEMGRDPLST